MCSSPVTSTKRRRWWRYGGRWSLILYPEIICFRGFSFFMLSPLFPIFISVLGFRCKCTCMLISVTIFHGVPFFVVNRKRRKSDFLPQNMHFANCSFNFRENHVFRCSSFRLYRQSSRCMEGQEVYPKSCFCSVFPLMVQFSRQWSVSVMRVL